MSDEEKKAIERIDYIQDFIIENGQYNADVNDMEYFSKILNLIEKQSKEIEELKDFITKLQATKDRLDGYDKENTLEIEKLKKEIEELKANKGYHLGFIDGGIAKRYEYEDKIKAKIEEIDEAIKVNKECAKDNADRITVRLLNDEINELKKARNVLQSLLEKE